MSNRFFLGFEVGKETKQLLFCRKKKIVDYNKVLMESFLCSKKLDDQDLIGTYCSSYPTIKDLQVQKETILTEIYRVIPTFQPKKNIIIMESFIGT